MSDPQTRKQVERIEALIHQFDQSSDPGIRAGAAELVQAVMELHGNSLGRIVDLVAKHGTVGQQILAELGNDEAVSGLLILYGFHPVGFGERVRGAIEKLEPLLQSHQANLELVSISESAVRLRLVAGNNGCHSSAGQVKQIVEDAIVGAAPDLTELLIEEVAPEAKPVFVPLQGLAKRKSVTNAEGVAVP